MKNHSLFWSVAVMITWFCLCGFTKPTRNHTLKPKSFTTEQKVKLPANKAIQAPDETESSLTNNKEEKIKVLDLSIPFKATDDKETSTLKTIPDESAQDGESNLFTVEQKKTSQAALQLKGGWVMSQEPEVEKRKSVDGAGIVINVKQ